MAFFFYRREGQGGMSEELKPCPFCGGPARKSTLLPGPGARFGCGECAIYACNAEDWNRRTPGPATERVLAKTKLHLAGEFNTPPDRELLAVFVAEHEPAKPESRSKECPWKRSDMTPCVRTDGPVAYADDHCCVGCGRRPILTKVPLGEPGQPE